jgi:hypothetical protein
VGSAVAETIVIFGVDIAIGAARMDAIFGTALAAACTGWVRIRLIALCATRAILEDVLARGKKKEYALQHTAVTQMIVTSAVTVPRMIFTVRL